MWWEAQEGWRWMKRENMYRESDGQTDGDRFREFILPSTLLGSFGYIACGATAFIDVFVDAGPAFVFERRGKVANVALSRCRQG